MLEGEVCSSRVISSLREESGDEELSVLPRHTKVIVTGNNRTKSVLVGLQGVVKKAVGLGGWHWLVNYHSILFCFFVKFTICGFFFLIFFTYLLSPVACWLTFLIFLFY